MTKKNEKVIDRLKPFGANFFMDPVTKRVYASTYKRQALFGPDEPFRNFLIPHFANRSRELHKASLFLTHDDVKYKTQSHPTNSSLFSYLASSV